jgi:carbon-monoxide dehydrogenase small subunit
MTRTRDINVTVNGKIYELAVEPRLLLADFLRQSLGLTGTHVGCEHGVCGACTVLVDGDSVRACLMFAVQADGCTIETVESLGSIGKLNPLQLPRASRVAMRVLYPRHADHRNRSSEKISARHGR